MFSQTHSCVSSLASIFPPRARKLDFHPSQISSRPDYIGLRLFDSRMKIAYLPCLLLVAATCVLATNPTHEASQLDIQLNPSKRHSFGSYFLSTSQINARAGGFMKRLKGCIACGTPPNGASTTSPPRWGRGRSPSPQREASRSPSRHGSRSPSHAPPPQRHRNVIATPNNSKLNFPPSTSGVVRLPQGNLNFAHNWPKK